MAEFPVQFLPKNKANTSIRTEDIVLSSLPPLSLYIHIPWCVRKCPYCDFNSHELNIDQSVGTKSQDFQRYVDALIMDLDQTLPLVWGRRLISIYFGGGTPSIFPPEYIDQILSAVRARLAFVGDIEITMEANPGTLDASRLQGFRDAGVNRLSIGVQSFDDQLLHTIGRIHQGDDAYQMVDQALKTFERVNMDLMFALPGQTPQQLEQDIAKMIALSPKHLSYYHLTIEPNTYFHKYPPKLPQDQDALLMQEMIEQAAFEMGLVHYEVSAFASKGQESIHNTNYWQYGDYIGIGAGAHGKISHHEGIERFAKYRHPKTFMDRFPEFGHATETHEHVQKSELMFEVMLNVLRLRAGMSLSLFHQHAGISIEELQEATKAAVDKGFLSMDHERIRCTDLGWRFLSDVQMMFL